MSTTNQVRHLTQADLLAELRSTFGDDPMTWAFRCPACGDVATGQDFRDTLTASPRTRRNGTPATASDYLGQVCIGRVLGALAQPPTNERGCDWAAGGLFSGPWFVAAPDGREIPSFPIAAA